MPATARTRPRSTRLCPPLPSGARDEYTAAPRAGTTAFGAPERRGHPHAQAHVLVGSPQVAAPPHDRVVPAGLLPHGGRPARWLPRRRADRGPAHLVGLRPRRAGGPAPASLHHQRALGPLP